MVRSGFDKMKSKAPDGKRALRRVTLHVSKREDLAEGEAAIARAGNAAERDFLERRLAEVTGPASPR